MLAAIVAGGFTGWGTPDGRAAEPGARPGDGDPSPGAEVIRWLLNRGRFDSAAENARWDTAYSDVPASSGPLAPNAALGRSSERHAEDLARTGAFQHATVPGSLYYDPSTQSEPWDRMEAEGFSDYFVVGENIARGQASPRQAYLGWWRSDQGHRQAMFDAEMRDGGAGIAGVTYVLDFGALWQAPPCFTGSIFHDDDGDGEYDAGEGIGGVLVELVAPGVDPNGAVLGDVSSMAGSFAVPLGADSFPEGTRVEVRLANRTGGALSISVPRDHESLEPVTIPAGGRTLIGAFTSAFAAGNRGFRDLEPAGAAGAAGLVLARIEPLPVRLRGATLDVPYRLVLRNDSAEALTIASGTSSTAAWGPDAPAQGVPAMPWHLPEPVEIAPGATWPLDVSWSVAAPRVTELPILWVRERVEEWSFELVVDVQAAVSVDADWQSRHALSDLEVLTDTDGDGLPGFLEARFGTDPWERSSRPDPEVRRAASGSLVLAWTGMPGIRYRVEGSPDLRTWTTVGDGGHGVSGDDPEVISVPVDGGPHRWFRLVVE